MKKFFTSLQKSKARIYFIVTLTISSIFLQACGGGGGGSTKMSGIQIPEDAHFVLSFNLKSMSSKNPKWEDNMREIFDKVAPKREKEKLKEVMTIMSNIDTKNNIYVFGKLDEKNKQSYGTFLLNFKDAKKLEALIKKNNEDVKVEEKAGTKYFTREEESIMVFKDNQVLFVFSEDLEDKKLIEIADKIIANKKTLSNQEYKAVMNKNHDIAFWADYRQIMSNIFESNDYLDMDALEEFKEYQDITTYATGFTNFENGKVVSEITGVVNKDKIDLFKKLYDKNGLDKKFVDKVALKSPLAMMGFTINISEIIKMIGQSSDMDLLTGDFALGLDTFTGIDVESLSASISIGVKKPKKLKESLVMLNFLEFEDKGKYYHRDIEIDEEMDLGDDSYPLKGILPVYIIPTDDALFVVTNEEMKDDVLAGKKVLQPKFAKSLTDNLSYMLLDVEAMTKKNALLTMFSFFKEVKNISVETKPLQGNKLTTKIEMNMKKSDNALVSLARLLNKSIEEAKFFDKSFGNIREGREKML